VEATAHARLRGRCRPRSATLHNTIKKTENQQTQNWKINKNENWKTTKNENWKTTTNENWKTTNTKTGKQQKL
jgi:hypothetical protein